MSCSHQCLAQHLNPHTALKRMGAARIACQCSNTAICQTLRSPNTCKIHEGMYRGAQGCTVKGRRGYLMAVAHQQVEHRSNHTGMSAAGPAPQRVLLALYNLHHRRRCPVRSEDDRDQWGGAIGDRHSAGWAHNFPAHGAGALPGQPGADAGVAEEVAARQLYGSPHRILRPAPLSWTCPAKGGAAPQQFHRDAFCSERGKAQAKTACIAGQAMLRGEGLFQQISSLCGRRPRRAKLSQPLLQAGAWLSQCTWQMGHVLPPSIS